jgi:agmatinase
MPMSSMFRTMTTLSLSALVVLAVHASNGASGAQQSMQDEATSPPSAEHWLHKYGPQIDQPFSGPLSFSHLPYSRCLEDAGRPLDIAVLGLPFDTAVTYRPGARFGPYAIRSGSRRQRPIRGWTLAWGTNPYELGSDVIDCGTRIKSAHLTFDDLDHQGMYRSARSTTPWPLTR